MSGTLHVIIDAGSTGERAELAVKAVVIKPGLGIRLCRDGREDVLLDEYNSGTICVVPS